MTYLHQIRCDSCPTTLTGEEAALAERMEKDGWGVDAGRDMDLCPECASAAPSTGDLDLVLRLAGILTADLTWTCEHGHQVTPEHTEAVDSAEWILTELDLLPTEPPRPQCDSERDGKRCDRLTHEDSFHIDGGWTWHDADSDARRCICGHDTDWHRGTDGGGCWACACPEFVATSGAEMPES